LRPSRWGQLRPSFLIDRGAAVAVAGDTVLVRAGASEYPYLTISNRDLAAQTVIRAAVGERVTLAGFSIENSDRWTIQGFRTGLAHSFVQDGSRQVVVRDNEFSPWGVTTKHSEDFLAEGNYVHDTAIEGTRTESEGYGFRATRDSGAHAVRPVWRNNRLERIHADAFQLGRAHDALIENNVIRDVADLSNVGEHNDVVQCFPACPGLILRNNDADGAHQGCMCGDASGLASTNVVIEGNRFANVRRIVLNIYDMPGVRVESNTVWGFGSNERLPLRLRDPNAPITGAVIRGNIFRADFGNEAGADAIEQEDYNLFPSRTEGRTYGPHDVFGQPTFEGLHELAAGSLGIDSGWRTAGAVDDRSPHTDLEGATVSRPVCVFLDDDPAKEGPVSFYVDRSPGSDRYRTENNRPWDLFGGSETVCNLRTFTPGEHTTTAVWANGQDSFKFTVSGP
jgi:Right handed beta helix region